MINIYLLRHAQTEYNAHMQKIGGRSNHIPLSELGERQAEKAGEWFGRSGLFFNCIFCSSANRAKITLGAVLDSNHLTDNDIYYTDSLNEVSRGDWEGLTRSEYFTPAVLAEMVEQAPNYRTPNGESHKDGELRMIKFITDNILDRYDDGNFLIVGHGLSFKCLLQGILGINPKNTHKIAIDNVSLTSIGYDKREGWFLNFQNRDIISR